jgi:hypothetical protein
MIIGEFENKVNTSENRQKYREFCKVKRSIPIFSKDWWLDATCGVDNWDVVLVEKGDLIIASLPYFIRKTSFKFVPKSIKNIFQISRICLPPLTQTMGVYIDYPPNQNATKRLSFEKDICNKLIEQLPRVDRFSQNFDYNFTNWLPFYWKGFRQTTRYTYVIENLTNLDETFSYFSHAKRKNIKKAKKEVTVKFDLSAKDFYENHRLTLKKQNTTINYSFDTFNRIYDAVYSQGCGKTIYAEDDNKRIHAALFVVWSEESAYDLISTIDPDFRTIGAATLLIQEIIKYVAPKTKCFDFEGSMIEPVEQSFRQFGTVQKPYFAISKTDSFILELALFVMNRSKRNKII